MKAWLPIFLAGTLSAAGATVEVAAPDSVRLADVTVTAIKQTSLNSDAGAATVLQRDQVERNDAVSVKAKTEEGLGFTGTEQGISAYAVASLEK